MSKVIKAGLPRPKLVDAAMFEPTTSVQQLIDAEMIAILMHD